LGSEIDGIDPDEGGEGSFEEDELVPVDTDVPSLNCVRLEDIVNVSQVVLTSVD
jgi:hypothetical protein